MSTRSQPSLARPPAADTDPAVGAAAEQLEADARWYAWRAAQEEMAMGPGVYVDLLAGMAADRATRARALRADEGTACGGEATEPHGLDWLPAAS